ncbi:MAG: hypothetical protein IIX21_00300 [Clostridia bacterium]|nr:hypothetical protein [Clostridia bacterium]
MKRIKMLITVVVIISITCIFSGCDQIIGLFGRGNFGTSSVPEADLSNLPAIEGVDFAYEIEYFNSTMLNTFTLRVGDKHTPTASVWAGDEDSCYSSDESVVFVAKNGNVFAKGRGTAYVVIKGIGNMFKIYKYIVK